MSACKVSNASSKMVFITDLGRVRSGLAFVD